MKQNKNKNLISVYITYSIAFFFLLCLGMWQLNKHKIKSDKINFLSSKNNKSSMELFSLEDTIKDIQIINIEGEFLEDKSLFFEPRTHKGKVGYHLIVPLKVENKYVMVNKGFVDYKKKAV